MGLVSEREFISKVLTLASLDTPQIPCDYHKPLQEVVKLGVPLPSLPHSFDYNKLNMDKSYIGEIEVNLKSIRPPKFNHSKYFSSNDTISQVKNFLCTTEPDLSYAQIKLLLRGKVLHDSLLLRDLKVNKVVLTVILSKNDDTKHMNHSQSFNTDSDSKVDETLQTENNIELPWEEIKQLLFNYIKDSKHADSAFERLRKGWELTQ